MTVELSAACLAALAAAPVVGLGVLVARMLGRSGRLYLTLSTLSRSRADLTVIALYDIAGAMVAILSLTLFGVTKPTLLVEYFNTDPVISWALFGALGPIFAVGLIDRLPVERLVTISRSSLSGEEFRATLARGSALRRKAVERVLACHYEDISVTEGSERRSLLHRSKQLIRTGLLHFDEIAAQITDYVAEFRDGDLPAEVSTILDSRTAWPTDHDTFEAALTLVGVALDQGLSRPISIACRIGENVPDDRPGSSAGAGPAQKVVEDG